jgi:hypothetical protein
MVVTPLSIAVKRLYRVVFRENLLHNPDNLLWNTFGKQAIGRNRRLSTPPISGLNQNHFTV